MKAKKNVPILWLFVLSSLFIIFCSCEGDKIDPGKAGRSLQLKAEIGGLKTRATNSSWEKDDAIGIYMVKAGQPLTTSSLRQNIKYVTTGSTSFKPGKDVEEITLPFDESNVDFISYYPYREDISNFSYPVVLLNQSAQADIDLMYSNDARGFNSKNPNVQMHFTHQLSKVILNITKDASVNLKELSVILTNAGTSASFNLSTGSLSSAFERENIQFRMDNDGSVAEAIILPETDLSGMELWFIIDEEETETYKFPLGNTLEIDAFEKSTKYTYNVTLFSEKRTVAVTESNINAWTEGPSADVRADRTGEAPPFIKGSKKTPFTIAEAQVNPGRTNVWVEGFIVGSSSGSTMNNFTPEVGEGASNSNIVLADISGEVDITKMMPVELGSGNIRNALNLKENPANLNKKVKIRGNLDTYYRVSGLKSIKQYEFTAP